MTRKKNKLVAEMKESNSAKLKYLLEVEMLGTWAVKCYQPNSDVFHYGVISPVAPNASLAEIISYISVNDPKCEIVNVQRLKRRIGTTWEDSPTLKSTFKGTAKADSVTIGKSFYRVRPYVSEPTQCYNCQRLGHTSHSCRGKTNCLVCLWKGKS